MQTKAPLIACDGNLSIITVRLADGRVADAWSTGKMIHNMNYLLGAEVAADNSRFVPRSPCLCNAGHALAATRALENLVGIELPPAAQHVRNLVHGLQFLIDHLTHFYLFYPGDWLDTAGAAQADPDRTAAFARTGRPEDPADVALYRTARQELASTAPPRPGGDAAYAASPEASLFVLSHVPAALATRARLTRVQSILQGGAAAKSPWHVGGLAPSAGFTAGSDPDLSRAARETCATALAQCRQFIEGTFLPDILLVADLYRAWARVGGSEPLLSWREFLGPRGQAPFFPGGLCTLADGVRTVPADPHQVREEQEPSWSAPDADRYRLRFGPEEPAYHWRNADFLWCSTPRLAGQACEVGPLARLAAAYAAGNGAVRTLTDTALARLGLPLEALQSPIGRVLARGLEAAAGIGAATRSLEDLDRCLSQGETALQASWTMPASGEGIGLAEIPRGALVHRIRLEDRRIVQHESLAPSLWNFSPRDAGGSRGPLEQALLAAPVADTAHPLALLRIIHAFDPCNACELRIEDDDTGQRATVHVH